MYRVYKFWSATETGSYKICGGDYNGHIVTIILCMKMDILFDFDYNFVGKTVPLIVRNPQQVLSLSCVDKKNISCCQKVVIVVGQFHYDTPAIVTLTEHCGEEGDNKRLISDNNYVGYACEGPCPCGMPSMPPAVATAPPAPGPFDCGCSPFEIDPVCTGEETIWNGCQAICQGKEIKCSSECPC